MHFFKKEKEILPNNFIFFNFFQSPQETQINKVSSTETTLTNNTSENINPLSRSSNLSIKFGTLLYSVFSLLIDAIKIRQDTVLIQSQQLNDNTNIQQQLNKETNAIKFAVVPSGSDQAEITKTQNINQNYSAERNNLQDLLITARQNGQIILTNTSTNINIMQQLAAKDSSFLKILNNIGSVVNNMSQPL